MGYYQPLLDSNPQSSTTRFVSVRAVFLTSTDSLQDFAKLHRLFGGTSLAEYGFSSRQVCRITGLTARQLHYWHHTDLVAPSKRTAGGHARYSFTDLIALKSAKRLLDAGISLQRVRKCLHSLTGFLPNSRVPLRDLSLVITGDLVLALHSTGAFDALSGEEWIMPVADIIDELESLQLSGQLHDPRQPLQWTLFKLDEEHAQSAHARAPRRS